MLRETVVGSAVLATAVILLAGLIGHLTFGLSVAAGLMLGSGNGYLVLALLNHRAPFVAGSLFRLISITALALMASLVFGLSMWPGLLGLAAAQLVMVAASVRQGMRA
ncbi:MAG TPA: hypothetical protein VGU71_14660 [Candidatus Dormibacteraeota bacterium]|nr:hypothetical protein [Candidatus Dormibacteraeota bacterium]